MEPTEKKYGVFISYSHKDKDYVSPLVDFFRTGRTDLVFLDYDSIKKGKKWRVELDNALLEAKIIMVFWCNHSAKSKEVQKEYETGINNNKDILPILLDDTKLSVKLAQYQWIDLRGFKTHKDDPPPPYHSRTLLLGSPLVAILLSAVIIALAIYAFYLFLRSEVRSLMYGIVAGIIAICTFYLIRRLIKREEIIFYDSKGTLAFNDELQAKMIIDKLNEKLLPK